MRDCEISGNNGNNFGSGLSNAGNMTMIGCSISSNLTNESGAQGVASRFGGGVYNTGTLFMTNCTVSGNAVHTLEQASGQNVSQGGGIYNAGTLHISHCTIADNATIVAFTTQLVGQGGGIYNTGALFLDDTILQDRSPTAGASNGGGTLVNFGGTITSKGYNLSNDSANGLLTARGDLTNTPALLGTLMNDGISTSMHLLLLGSPAIDAGDPAFTPPPAADQRGWPRIIGARTDIGAVEYKPVLDFLGDGRNDVLLQNSQTGRLVAWSMNGLSVQGGLGFVSAPAAGWKYVGSADFNHDGWPDMIFQNTSTNQMVIWFMRGSVYIGGAVMLPPLMNNGLPAPTYTAVGVTNLQVVFEDTMNRQVYYWIFGALPGVPLVQTGPYGPFLPNYHVVGLGDFNRGGSANLLFQNTVTRQLVVTQLNGATFAGGGAVSHIPESGWEVRAVADFNNDGWPDIVFQNPTTNIVVVWFMNGLTFTKGGLTSAQPLVPYQVIGPH